MTQHNLVVINEGTEPICIREMGQSIIDVTFCSKELARKILDWKVHSIESLADYKYITMNINGISKIIKGKKQEYLRWKLYEINEDFQYDCNYGSLDGRIDTKFFGRDR